MSAEPLVSLGVPTYNRSARLERAVMFMLEQDYRNIEVVISDNASTDDTPQVCERLSHLDRRVRYVRQTQNIGPIANYMAVLEAARGEMYAALADDDWIEKNYVSACLRELLDDPALVLVCGRGEMVRGGEFSHWAAETRLVDDSPADRVVRYYWTVEENGAFHGVVRRSAVLSVPRMVNTMGGDWLWMASVAFLGKIKTIPTTRVVKHMGGTSVTFESIAKTLGLPGWQARYWQETILASAVADIAWRSPVYEPLGAPGRVVLAGGVAAALAMKWRIWHRWYSMARARAGSLRRFVVAKADP